MDRSAGGWTVKLSLQIRPSTVTMPIPRWRVLLWRWLGLWEPEIVVVPTVVYSLLQGENVIAQLGYARDKDPGVAAVLGYWRKVFGEEAMTCGGT